MLQFAEPTVMSDGVQNDREDRILEHMGQVRSIARRIQQRLPQHVPLDDLVSVGILGLIQAVDNYDPKRDVRLSTYAEFKIRGAILDGLRHEDWVPRQRRKRSKEIQAAILAAQQKLQRSPAEEEIAAELGIGLAEYHDWLSDIQSLVVAVSGNSRENDDEASLLEYVADDGDNMPSTIVERLEMERILSEEIERLPETERTVLMLYYQKELAPCEISQVVRIKATRVSQIRCQAIARLRANLTRRLNRVKVRI